MKRVFLHKISSLLTTLALFLLTLFVFINNSYADINQTRAFAGFINYIYLNTETIGNGNDLCVFGSDEVTLQLSSVIEEKKHFKELGEEINVAKNYNECKIIYIAQNKEKDAKQSVQFFNEKGALTVAIFPGFVTDGGMMYVDIGRRNFELTVNELAIKKSGVKIDSSIVSLIVR